MKYIILLVLAFLVGCSTPVPVTRKFPDAPQELLQHCAELKTIENDNVKLSEFVKIVVENYGLYQNCSAINNSWIDWYNSQKNIYDTIK
jgi:hypothetical protein